MFEALIKILPVILTFSAGFLLKKTNVFTAEDGGLFLKLVFFVASPALTFLSISNLDITPQLLSLPLIAVVTLFSLHAFNTLISSSLSVPRKTLGIYMTGTLIANTGFALPFLLATYGEEAAARVYMYELLGSFLVFVFVYSIAVKHGDKRPSNKFIMQKLLISPPVWALILGLIVNFGEFTVPFLIESWFKALSNLVAPLIMLSLGLYFSPQISHFKLLSLGVMVRMLGGFVVGATLCQVFGLTGLDRAVTIICSAAPIGYNTLTFANMEKLDTKFAASLVSIGIALGLFWIPFLTLILK